MNAVTNLKRYLHQLNPEDKNELWKWFDGDPRAIEHLIRAVGRPDGEDWTKHKNAALGRTYSEPVVRKVTEIERKAGRPENFYELSSVQQWDIDKRLGILDWDGTYAWLHRHGKIAV